MQWLIDIVIAKVFEQLPNLVSFNDISPSLSTFAHGDGDNWKGVSDSVARDALSLGDNDTVEFGLLVIDALSFNNNAIWSSNGTINHLASDLANVGDIDCASIESDTIDAADITCDSLYPAEEIIMNHDPGGLAIGWAGAAAEIDIRRAGTGLVILRELGAARARMAFGADGGDFLAWDDSTVAQFYASAYQTGGVQGYFALGNIGIGTKTPARMLDVAGDITLESGSGDYYSNDGSQGWTGTFLNGDGDTVTVKNGIVTGVA